MPATFNKNAPLGTCVWCGKDLPRNKDGSPSKVRRWHPDCVAAYRELIDTAHQVKLVEKRDGRRCFDCGRTHYVVGVKTWEVGSGFCGLWFGDHSYIGQGVHIYDWGDVDGPFTPVRFREIALELDHDVPLWRVAHLPDEERIKYFRIENLRLRCRECHKAKTAREAAERAKLKRLARKRQAHLDRMAEKSTWQAPS